MANKVGLTDAKIAGLKAPTAGQIELADGIVPGLRLRMGASGIKTYILRKRVQGKWLNVTIGRHGPSFTLAHARKKARDLLVDVEQGKSIARKAGAKRKGSKGVGTVAELYETYLAQQIEGKKRSAREFDRVFRKYIEPEIGDRLADSITRSDVSRFVEKIAFERGKETLTMARIVYRHLSTFYTWALTRLEHMPANPCRDAWRPKRNEPRDRVLSDRELAALWQSAVEDGYPFGHLVQMLVLTAQRRGEVLDAACDEFDFKAKVWTVPGDRAKNGKANVVPLVDALLHAFPRSLADEAGSAAAKTAFRENFRALKQTQQLLATGGTDWRLWQKLRGLRLSMRGSPTPDGYDDLATAVMLAADNLVSHPGPLEDAVSHARALVEGAQSAMTDYETRKRELGVIDFSDMVTNAARILEEKPAVLGAVMEEVDCVIVDEFQDTNPIQFTFLWALARKAKRALIVGDTKQAIMGFQGADPRLTVALTQQFKTSPLDRNWRSDPRIMDFVNALGPCLFGEDYTALAAQNASGHDTALEVIELASKRGARSGGKPQHFIADRLLSLLTDDRVTIVDRHSKALRDLEPRDVAILCPTHNHCASYAAALRALGLPVRVAEGGWWQSKIVQAACFALRFAVDPADNHAAICTATLGPGATPLGDALGALARHGRIETPELTALLGLWPDSLATPVDRLVHQVIQVAGLRDWCDRLDDPAQMRADLLRFEAEAAAFMDAHRDMREASGFYGQSANVFLGWLENKVGLKGEDLRPNPAGAEADGIEIVTWHASKGREWPVVVVCGLDHKLDPRAGTFSTKFPGFDDLDHVIEQATLAYAPDFAAPEATARFLKELYPECEETAHRLLYVALTRARDRLIIEWPQDDDKVEPPLPITARRLLNDSCGMKLQGNQITVGSVNFPSRMTICGKEIPASFDGEGRVRLESNDREPRFAIERRAISQLTPVISPSQTIATTRPLPSQIETRPISAGVRLTGSDLAQATDKGTAVHEALRILLCRPDLRHRVGQHCRIAEAEVELLAQQAQALRQTLTELGYSRLHIEQPIEIELADGGRQSIIVDLIAEGAHGFMIVDHKSGPVADHAARFESYWPQLAAYVDAVSERGGKAVHGAAVFWTETGEITVGRGT